MLQGQMLPVQMLLGQLKSVQDSPMNLPLKFGPNRVSNSWYIPDMDKSGQEKIGSVTAAMLGTLSLCGVVGWWGGVQSHFCVKPNFGWIVVELTLSWGFDNIYF